MLLKLKRIEWHQFLLLRIWNNRKVTIFTHLQWLACYASGNHILNRPEPTSYVFSTGLRDSPLQSTLVTEWEDDVWRKANCILQSRRVTTPNQFVSRRLLHLWMTHFEALTLNLFLGFFSTWSSLENPRRFTSLRSNWSEMLNGVKSTWSGLQRFKGQTSDILAQRFLNRN